MSMNIRFPAVSAVDTAGKLAQIQSYMHQLVEQLNWAFDNIDTSVSNVQKAVEVTSAIGKNTITPQDAVATFNSIKALIIKSADIIEAYYETFNKRFEGYYLAQSDFGTFMEQYWMDLEVDPTGISQLFTNVQEITDTLNGLNDMVMNTNAYIRTGKIDTVNGIDVYGIEVGQTTTISGQPEPVWDKFARFTSEGIFFYLPGSTEAVAYMTGNRLYITEAVVTGSLLLGKFRIDTSNGLAFKWVGG